jgi:hypothetical protein
LWVLQDVLVGVFGGLVGLPSPKSIEPPTDRTHRTRTSNYARKFSLQAFEGLRGIQNAGGGNVGVVSLFRSARLKLL